MNGPTRATIVVGVDGSTSAPCGVSRAANWCHARPPSSSHPSDGCVGRTRSSGGLTRKGPGPRPSNGGEMATKGPCRTAVVRITV